MKITVTLSEEGAKVTFPDPSSPDDGGPWTEYQPDTPIVLPDLHIPFKAE